MHVSNISDTRTQLSAGQRLHFPALQGDLIYVSFGKAGICSAPVWMETPYFESELVLREGESYTVGNKGWATVSAYEHCELIRICPASRWQKWAEAVRTGLQAGRLALLLRLKRKLGRWVRAT
ncbi:hypothetical protein [Undibacterium terreum]|uniref:Uncharacterized protein n=1 Tax=Undibacterium terreum TaxID=1224302 RepID=A0A916V085_9BURK|nr:hypothetical protein [Undibacterium terreum]GGC95845.1 hypothetical protein GCM10011396_49060 [Undibacterium terreum]